VHTDPQSQRRKWRQLQLQRTRHRIARACEREHEAVALALLDGTNGLMPRNDFGEHVVETRDGRRHFLRLALPEPR